MTNPILACSGLTVSFGRVKALSDVEIAVERGEILGILGPNGAGKTTLFNAFSGHVTPDAGTITFNDNTIIGLRPDQIFQLGLARTFQLPELVESLSIGENVLIGALFAKRRGLSDALSFQVEAVAAAETALEIFGLSNVRAKRTELADLFERKLIMMASAFAARPVLMLLDEPAGGLTDDEIGIIMDHIRTIAGAGITIVLIEHVMRVLMELSHRVIMLHQGRLLAQGRPEEVKTSAEVQRLYFGDAT